MKISSFTVRATRQPVAVHVLSFTIKHVQLKENLPDLLKEMNAQKIMEQMWKLEDHLKNFMEINEENIGILESFANNISAEIGDIRRKLNGVLDDIEKIMTLVGNRIYKEWLIRKQEQNHQCQSLLSAIRNSQVLLESVAMYGSCTQNFVVTSKTMKQLQCYSDQIREKYERVDNIKIRLELDSNMKVILSKNAVGLVKIVCQEETKDLQCTSLMIPHHKRTVELSRVIDVHCPSEYKPAYLGIVQLPDGYIVLADWNNKICCLFDSSCNFITRHTLPNKHRAMCLIGDNEVAIAMADKKTIQFLSIRDRSMRDIGTLRTKYECYGVDALSREEIVVSGHCGDTYSNKCYWSLMTRNGKVKLHHEFDCQQTYNVHAALDISRSRVYISVSGSHAVYCFGLTDGKQYFIYLSNDLKNPLRVAVDREDNIYVVGYNSNNIHKLSPNGVTIQVISSGVPQQPRGISFNYSRDHFIISSESEMRKLHYFVHK